GSAIGIGVALELAREQPLERVDRHVAAPKIVIEPQHFDEQAGTQAEWRRDVFRGIARRRIEQHLPLERAEAPGRSRQAGMHRVVPARSRQDLRQPERPVGGRWRVQLVIFERAPKLVRGRRAGHYGRRTAHLANIGMGEETSDGALKAPKVGDPVKTSLAGRYHLMSGRRTAASKSSSALINNIIDPDAAEDASQAI